ncbi:Beta-galactosidase C-terminal domain [Catellatospora aurea]|uniref:Beta-galactosidase C-terminal domain n=1 Tax=Catellatospora aurea TaxID=1337874 RepID=A0ABW2GXM0_9ACTN
MRQVLSRHGIVGPYADVPDLETAVRVAPDGTRLLFLLNHATAAVEVVACATGLDLLSGQRMSRGRPLVLDPAGVMVIRCDASL